MPLFWLHRHRCPVCIAPLNSIGLRKTGDPWRCESCNTPLRITEASRRFSGFLLALYGLVLIVVGAGTGSWILLLMLIPTIYIMLYALLALFDRVEEADAKRCADCHYDLRGTLAAGRTECPECGAKIDASDEGTAG